MENRPPLRDDGQMPSEAVAIARSIDFKIPLWGVIILAGSLAYWLIWMNIQQSAILVSMAELKAAVITGNSQTSANTGEIAIMKFRLEKIESELERANNGAQRRQ